MSKEDLIKKILVVDETKILEDILELASEFISLTNSGEILVNVDEGELSVKERIVLYMIGKKYAFEAKLVASEHVGLGELSKQLGASKNSTAARVAELRNERKVKDVKRGEYNLQIYDLKKYLLAIKKRIERK